MLAVEQSEELLLLQHSIDIYVQLLVIKGHPSLNGSSLSGRILIPPDHVLVFFSFNRNAVILRKSFIRTNARCLSAGKVFPFDLQPSADFFP